MHRVAGDQGLRHCKLVGRSRTGVQLSSSAVVRPNKTAKLSLHTQTDPSMQVHQNDRLQKVSKNQSRSMHIACCMVCEQPPLHASGSLRFVYHVDSESAVSRRSHLLPGRGIGAVALGCAGRRRRPVALQLALAAELVGVGCVYRHG